jgi:hypothetical protein
LDLITLANNIINAATSIDADRKGFATRGFVTLTGKVMYVFLCQYLLNNLVNA